MPEFTKEEKDNFEEKLKAIELDLDNVPEFLMDFKQLDFQPTKRCDNKEYLVYKYVPISKIQILIAPTNRLADIKEKYSLAKPISEYIVPKTEEEIENFAIFLNMLRNTSLEEINHIETKQKELNKAIPFRVKYEKNYLWQIYYCEYSDQYFMIVPSEEAEYETLFYLLREQIKQNKNKNEEKYIYVPILNLEPTNTILKKNEVKDIYSYLWLFTKKWPNIYEVTNKENCTSIIVIGQAEVYPSIYATYRIELETKDKALKLYKELKALFILQTELSNYYTFRVQIDSNGEIQLCYGNEVITYEKLPQFIETEYLNMEKNIENSKREISILGMKLETLKQEASKKEKEFLEKQKEISTYLQYKRTFFGKVKYFFTKKKARNKQKKEIEEIVTYNNEIPTRNIEHKPFYTLEDLIVICNMFTDILTQEKNKKLDIDALELKINNLKKKIENATLFINEIDNHKKSIFEFWKFSSKDETLTLNEAETEEVVKHEGTLRKVFDYESDRDDIVKQLDCIQRQILCKEETDIIFVARTQILTVLNKIKTLIKVTDEKISDILDELKKEANRLDRLYEREEYNIFGSVGEDGTNIKSLGGVKHREVEKDKFQILGINQNTTLNEFKETLRKIEAVLSKCFGKVRNIIDMPIYKVTMKEEKIDLYNYSIYSLNVEDTLNDAKLTENEYNLFRINLREGMPAIFYTNIILFDNYNKTLPLGMDKVNDVLINSDDYSFTLLNKKTIYTNQYFEENIDSPILKLKKINIYEYDIDLKIKK